MDGFDCGCAHDAIQGSHNRTNRGEIDVFLSPNLNLHHRPTVLRILISDMLDHSAQFSYQSSLSFSSSDLF